MPTKIERTPLITPELRTEKAPSTKKEGVEFRIKKVGVGVLVGLGITLAAATIVAASLASFGIVPIALAIGTGTALAGVAGVALWGRVTPHLPEKLKNFSHLIQSVAHEILACVTLGFLFPINLTRFDPKNEEDIDKTQVPVLLIHGFLGGSNNWIYHKRRLKEEGYKNVFTIDLGSPLNSIEEYGIMVKKKVDEIRNLTGRDDIILVGHSMGGLVARQYLYHNKPKEVTVRQVITLGTPLAGTKVARLASWINSCVCAQEMLPKSKLTEDLQKCEDKDKLTKFYHVGTKVDLIIRPRKSATPEDHEKTVLNATPHAGYLFSDAAGDILVREILNTNKEALSASS